MVILLWAVPGVSALLLTPIHHHGHDQQQPRILCPLDVNRRVPISRLCWSQLSASKSKSGVTEQRQVENGDPFDLPSLKSWMSLSHELNNKSPLSMEFDQLARVLDGKGRAKTVWDCLRCGVDPLDLSNDWQGDTSGSETADISVVGAPSSFGRKARNRYIEHFQGNARIADAVSRVSKVQVSSDGTMKLLLHLHHDGLEVETVIIPWEERKTSTLCISSQVGCRQGCTFCMTGRMGILRSLSADEILSQVFHAMAMTTRTRTPLPSLSTTVKNDVQDPTVHYSTTTYPIDNIVFMGMGEPGDNVDAVLTVAQALVDGNQFQFAPRRVTVSTVAPSPQTFVALGKSPVQLAWSVHSSRDEIRKQLVPTTRHGMVELRDQLIEVLLSRPKKLQSIMLEITILDGINDSIEDAKHLIDFCLPIQEQVPNGKVVVNLIPWNDISASSGPAQLYKAPPRERQMIFQRTLVEHGLRCYIRTTRGDDESAACGQLATKSTRRRN